MRLPVAAACLFAIAAYAVDAGHPLRGYTPEDSATEVSWEQKFRRLPDRDHIRENMRRLSARPHHVGSPYDKDNAEWLLAQLQSFGLDAKIETFSALFPTPKSRKLELLGPAPFTAKLQEPPVSVDPTSSQTSEQLPTYNAYSRDGDVTAPLSSRATARAGAASSPKLPPSTEPSAASFTPIRAKMATTRATPIPRVRCVLRMVRSAAA